MDPKPTIGWMRSPSLVENDIAPVVLPSANACLREWLPVPEEQAVHIPGLRRIDMFPEFLYASGIITLGIDA